MNIPRSEMMAQCTMEMQRVLAKYGYYGAVGVMFDANAKKEIIPQIFRLTAEGPGSALCTMAICYEDILKNISTIAGYGRLQQEDFTVKLG